jgi:transposase
MAMLCHGETIEPGLGSFDLVVRLSTLRPKERITIPRRKTCVLNKWLPRPGARLVQGCALSEKTIVVRVEFPEPKAREGADVIGIDVGIRKLIATSDEQAIGEDWRQISARVRRRRPGSKGKRRARIAPLHQPRRQAIAVASALGHRLRRLERIETRQIPKQRQELPHSRRPLDLSAGETTDRISGTGKPCLAHCVDPRGTSRTCPACGKDDRRKTRRPDRGLQSGCRPA